MAADSRVIFHRLAVAVAALGMGLAQQSRLAADAPADAVEFNRDIRPILAEACYQCHGPDAAQRKADLRLDSEEDAKAARDGGPAIVPGNAAGSELMRRITADDNSQRMPPPEAGPRLNEVQVALVRRWVDSGAKWQPHWSFLAPHRPALPAVADATWPRNEIDAFVLARLGKEGLTPAPPGDKITLLRRVTLDLTGLPPTPAEVDAFLADETPEGFEKVVDRLLASPHYGERMAAPWLDAARYADTNGYQTDGERTMWRWRDWVIEALNRNMPFDQFTVEQLAGDMLPGATLDQRIATGFNRNHRGNGEGGIIAEEFAVEYAVDRVETTSTVWLGLTVGCARCHDHKYDPISQREFYQLFAFFNQVPERGRAVKVANSPPFIKTPTREQQVRLTQLAADVAAAERRAGEMRPQLDAAQARWEESRPTITDSHWSVTRELAARLPCEPTADAKAEIKFVDGDAAFVPGRIGAAYSLDGQRYVECGDVADFGYFDKFTIAAWIKTEDGTDGVIWSRMKDEPDGAGYNLQLVDGKLQVNLVQRWLDDALRVETVASVPRGRWTHVALAYDGSRLATGVKLYVDGQEQPLRVIVDLLYQTFQAKEPFRIGAAGPAGRWHGAVDDVRIYRACLEPAEIELVAVADAPGEILALPAAQRTPGQAHKLQACFVDSHAQPSIRDACQAAPVARRKYQDFVESIPTTMVMEDVAKRRETFVLVRGRYDQPGEKVSPDIPAFLAPAACGEKNRLGLARWLVSPANPLTARVAVNRFWQLFFGTGLVRTVDDFGTQGEPPSHPELLDWLARELVEGGWDMKALARKIVTSATYRQSSHLTPAALRRDPENRLLARGPRMRLSAETIRDAALAASGLLDRRVGGPSVKPYQPPRLWMELTGTIDYDQSHGADLYRPSIYTYVKRTAAPPAMITLDSSPRETCCVRVTRTNTPLQALVLMNDVTFVEAARVLAERAMTEAGADPAERIVCAFRLVIARRPTADELATLVGSYQRHLAHYRQQPQEADRLAQAGEAPRKTGLDPCELAAHTAVASLILNLDEAITKE